MNGTTWSAKLTEAFSTDPMLVIALAAAAVAFATTPLAFAVLGRHAWFQSRRGRVLRRPGFAAVVCAMLLVMGVPAIFAALVVKSQSFDKNRYEFDPNKTWSVLEQGRGFKDVQEADQRVKAQEAFLEEERKNLVNTVKKLDEAMLKLRAVAGTSPAVAQTVPTVLQRLADVRKSIKLDAPQQLMDFTAPPADLAATPATVAVAVAVAPVAPAAVAPAASQGLTKAQVDDELATVPAPQKTIAAQLPLVDLPKGWTVEASGPKHLETFNADNLFEKIDGRAESFIQYDVKGMAYASYHPTGDDSADVQVYIFEMGDALKALGKYGSEKPDAVKPLPIGSEGYTTAGSTLFYSGPYYTQIVSTRDDAQFAGFAKELAERIAATQKPKPSAATAAKDGPPTSTPEALFALLPAGPGRAGPKYVPQDVFGYSFLTDVFMADYGEGDVTWQGFLRPYPDAKAAQAVFDNYVEDSKKNGAEVKTVEAEGADRMVVSSNIGLVDVFFIKGNVIAGANGCTEAGRAETFARAFARKLPGVVPMIATNPQ